MARTANPNPTYLRHRASGKARVVVLDHGGKRKEILLPGPFNSPESLEEYHRVCALIRGNNGRLPMPNGRTADLTIAEFVLRYMTEHVERYYLDVATKVPTSERDCLRAAFRPLVRLYGPLLAIEFDSLKLEALQEAMATGTWLNDTEREKRTKQRRAFGAARTTINSNIDRIKRLFRWGCAKKLIPAENLVNLDAVANLREGRCAARETPAVVPVEPAVVEATLQHLPPVVADVIRLLLLTGARVGELCQLRAQDIDRSGPVWLYRVEKHKNRHRGLDRTIAFGPRAQLVLRRYLGDDPAALLFSPAAQQRLYQERRRAERKTPHYPSHLRRLAQQRAARRQRAPGAQFTAGVINTAVRRACKRAGIPRWHVHQLRHSTALAVMREHGVEAARAVLGHQSIDLTVHYAGQDKQRAAEVAAKIG
jgi:integrase